MEEEKGNLLGSLQVDYGEIRSRKHSSLPEGQVARQVRICKFNFTVDVSKFFTLDLYTYCQMRLCSLPTSSILTITSFRTVSNKKADQNLYFSFNNNVYIPVCVFTTTGKKVTMPTPVKQSFYYKARESEKETILIQSRVPKPSQGHIYW